MKDRLNIFLIALAIYMALTIIEFLLLEFFGILFNFNQYISQWVFLFILIIVNPIVSRKIFNKVTN